MKYLVNSLFLFVFVFNASAVESVSVFGGSFLQDLIIEDGQPVVIVASFSTVPTSLLITPSSEQSEIQLRYTPFNLSGENWAGLDFALSAGVFSEDPVSLFSDPGDVESISSGNRATLLDMVGVNGSSTTVLDLVIPPGPTPTTLSITPIVPEPATAALIALPLLIGCRGSRKIRVCRANPSRARDFRG
ncbi:MAG: hypothetical protein AAF593_04770 [Planctomycetota bacterium]